METLPSEVPEMEPIAEIGRVALADVPIDWWWTQGTTYDLPTFGAEMLGKDF